MVANTSTAATTTATAAAAAAAAAAVAACSIVPCARCILRARNIRHPAAYAAATTTTTAAAGPPQVCPVCLGVLQDHTLSAITANLAPRLAAIRHARQIKINATLPPSISLVRDRAFRLSYASNRYASAAAPLPPLSSTTVTSNGANDAPTTDGIDGNSRNQTNDVNSDIDVNGNNSSNNNNKSAAGNHITLRESLKWTLSPMLRAAFALDYHPEAELFLDLVFTHPPSANDVAFAAARPPPAKRRRHSDVLAGLDTTMHITRVMDTMSDQEFATAVPHLLPPPPAQQSVTVDTSVSVAPLYFAGTYNKFSRAVSQTPWHADDPDNDDGENNNANNDGENGTNSNHNNDNNNTSSNNDDNKTNKRSNISSTDHRDTSPPRRKFVSLSVEDVVLAGLREELRAEKLTFSAGGREDVDVRMLGTGRPFFIEVLNSHIVPSMVDSALIARAAAKSAATSSAVRVRGLRQVDKRFGASLRLVEADKRKHYRAVVWTAQPFPLAVLRERLEQSHPQGFQLQQRTPLRVLHRRTQAVRPRAVYTLSIVRVVTPHVFVIDLEAQAGTYIKEFVHGDNGRTVPNVAQLLGCDADILQLDVTHISMQGGGLAAIAAAATTGTVPKGRSSLH